MLHYSFTEHFVLGFIIEASFVIHFINSGERFSKIIMIKAGIHRNTDQLIVISDLV